MIQQSQNVRRRGFSLTELAIVMSVIGFIIGAVWLAVSRARDYSLREQAVEAVASTVTNMRNYYAGQAGVPAVTYDAMTAALTTANVIPSFLQRSSSASCTNAGNGGVCADTPWGPSAGGAVTTSGTYHVCNWNMGVSTLCTGAPVATSPYFAVEMMGLLQKTCVALVQSISGARGAPGLAEIDINGVNMLATGKTIQPLSDLDAVTNCTLKADGSNTIRFVYRITAPTP